MNNFNFLTVFSYLLTTLFSLFVLGAMIVVISWPKCKGKGWIIAALAIQLVQPLIGIGLNILTRTLSQPQWPRRSSFDYFQLMEIVFLLMRFVGLAVPVFLLFGFLRLRGHLKAIVKGSSAGQPAQNRSPDQPLSLAVNIPKPIGQTNQVHTTADGNNIYDDPMEMPETPGYARELVILGFGIAGLLGLLPFAVIAWSMASNDLYKMKSGKEQKDATAKTLTTIGYFLGITGTLIATAIIIAVAGYNIEPIRR